MFAADTPKKEVPLGDDFIAALRKYAELNTVDAPKTGATFSDLETKSLTAAVPKLAPATAKQYQSDIKHLKKSFVDAPLDEIQPMHIGKFLDKHADKPTTANRCKRLFSTMWNHARGWGYTDLANPCEGIRGYALEKRTVYIAVYGAVYAAASAPLRDAMDLA